MTRPRGRLVGLCWLTAAGYPPLVIRRWLASAAYPLRLSAALIRCAYPLLVADCPLRTARCPMQSARLWRLARGRPILDKVGRNRRNFDTRV